MFSILERVLGCFRPQLLQQSPPVDREAFAPLILAFAVFSVRVCRELFVKFKKTKHDNALMGRSPVFRLTHKS